MKTWSYTFVLITITILNTFATNVSAQTPGGGQNAVQRNNASAFSGDETKFSFNGTNVGIGTTNGINAVLDIRGNEYISGNIGIGISNPTKELYIAGGGQTSLQGLRGVYINPNATNVEMTLESNDGHELGMIWGGVGIIGTWTNDDLVFRTNNIEVARLTTSGNLGIGSTAPGAKLDVQGVSRFNSSVGIGTSGIPKNTLDVKGSMVVGSGYASTKIASTNGLAVVGNVGIGTWNPQKELHVAGGGQTSLQGLQGLYVNPNATNVEMTLESNDGHELGMIWGGVALMGTWTNDDLVFRTNNTEVARLTTSGNLGIGSTAPGAKLDVQGASRFNGNIGIAGGGQTSSQGLQGIYVNPNSPNVEMTLESNDGHELGMIWGGVGIIGTWTNDDLVFRTNNIEVARLTKSGNLGIGSTAPGAALDVNGNVRMVAAGNKFFTKEGTNACSGVSTLSGGAVTVNTTCITSNSRVILTSQNCSSCGTTYLGTVTAGTSFVINSSNASDGSNVYWQIVDRL